MSHFQILNARTSELKARLQEIAADATQQREADTIRREIARRVGCAS